MRKELRALKPVLQKTVAETEKLMSQVCALRDCQCDGIWQITFSEGISSHFCRYLSLCLGAPCWRAAYDWCACHDASLVRTHVLQGAHRVPAQCAAGVSYHAQGTALLTPEAHLAETNNPPSLSHSASLTF